MSKGIEEKGSGRGEVGRKGGGKDERKRGGEEERERGGGGSPAFCRHCSKSASAAAAKSGKKRQILLNLGNYRI